MWPFLSKVFEYFRSDLRIEFLAIRSRLDVLDARADAILRLLHESDEKLNAVLNNQEIHQMALSDVLTKMNTTAANMAEAKKEFTELKTLTDTQKTQIETLNATIEELKATGGVDPTLLAALEAAMSDIETTSREMADIIQPVSQPEPA